MLWHWAMKHLMKVVADVAALAGEGQAFEVVAPCRIVKSDAVVGSSEQFQMHHERADHEASATLARLAMNSDNVLRARPQVTGSAAAKTLDHNQRWAVVVLKRKMSNHHVKVLGVIKALRAEIVDLVRAGMLCVQEAHNLRYGVAVERFHLGQLRLGHSRLRVVRKITDVAAREAHGDDVFLEN